VCALLLAFLLYAGSAPSLRAQTAECEPTGCQIRAVAMVHLGLPYRFGGATRKGFDCAALVGAVFRRFGVELPRTAARQVLHGKEVPVDELAPGDLVFFRDTYRRGVSHVGIYLGDGRFIHAAGRRRGVIISSIRAPYYAARYVGARRVVS